MVGASADGEGTSELDVTTGRGAPAGQETATDVDAAARQDVVNLRRGYEALAAGDIDTVLELIHPEIEVAVYTDRPDLGTDAFRGHDGFLANYSDMTDAFEDFIAEPVRLERRGDQVLVECHVTGRGRSSGVAVDATTYHVWTVADGLATRLEIHSDADRARAAYERQPPEIT